MEQADRVGEEIDMTTKNRHATCIQVKEYDYEWKVKNLQYFHADIDEYYLESPAFLTIYKDNHFKWQLEVFPDTMIGKITDYVVVRLVLLDNEYPDSSVIEKVDVQLALLNKEGEKVNVQNQVFTIDELLDVQAFFKDFVRKDYLYNESNGLVQNNEVTFLCKIFISEGYEHDLNPPKSLVHEIPADRRVVEFDDLETLFEFPKFSDVELIVGKTVFSAHKAILAARSRVFAAMFEHGMQEQRENRVEIVDVDAAVMQEVLRFIYAGKVQNIQVMRRELLEVAEKYMLDGLKETCEQVLIDNLSLENVAETLVIIDRCATAQRLKVYTLNFLTMHAKNLANSEEFKTVFHSLSRALLIDVINVLMLK